MKRVLVAILIPILALLGWVSSLSYHIATSKTIQVRIQGFDPRDLLSGHYINFSLALDGLIPCDGSTREERCVCYSPSSDGVFHEAVWAGSCDAKPSPCATFLRGRCERSRFEAGVERYSIPEYLAPVLGVLPQNSSALLSLNSSGEGHVLKLFTDGVEIEEWAAEKLSASEAATAGGTPEPTP